MPKASILGKDFKTLTSAVTKFPSLGSFAGTELISLQVQSGKLTATTAGVAMSWADVPVEGTIPFIGVGEREVLAFAGICPDTAKVYIEVIEKLIHLRCKGREIVLPLAKGREQLLPVAIGVRMEITKELAVRLNYLAQIAYNDSTKPELCCVMLTVTGQAIAVNQKAIASLKYPSDGAQTNVALPVLLAKTVTKGDVVFAGPKETMLRSGIATYCVPSPVKAQAEFPVATVVKYGEAEREVLAKFEGARLSDAIIECNTILSSVTRTEIFVSLAVGSEKMEVTGENGGIKFRASIPLLASIVEGQLKVPIDEMLHVAAFLGKTTVIARGAKGEVFFSFGLGWTMFPRWRPGKG